ncbi:MAG TPA: ribosomal protein S18-alanine N-acetyltransferase [Bryobacteraceae bacterium]|nr:ribosomal protein S18-alanine N-acetyltransferase [Bryobacteraceae bacterium]
MFPRFEIRRFRLADLGRIQEIEHASFGKEAYDRKLFADLARECGSLFLVAARGRRVWGYMVTHATGDRAELVSVAVDPAVRGKGAASALMSGTLRRLQRRGTARFSLMVKVTNDTAVRFYQKFGFRRGRRVGRYYEDGSDAWVMWRKQ